MTTSTNVTIVKGDQVILAWKWFCQNISQRPSNHSSYGFIFDKKTWASINQGCLLSNDSITINNIHNLYLTSQFSGDPSDLVEISMGVLKDTKLRTRKVEDGIRKIICDQDSFRYSLSENLACWAQLATLAQANFKSKYVVSLPNASPRDPGPDGLSLLIGIDQPDIVEIRSVKSAKNRNPKPLIVSTRFANGGDADPTKQIDELFLICSGEHGFIKFDRLLTDIFYRTGRTAQDEYRSALIQKHSKLNAVVVADNQYATPEIFSSFVRIPRLPADRIGTYIGVDNWDTFSRKIQTEVLKTLNSFGLI